jgi:hypothetical protein
MQMDDNAHANKNGEQSFIAAVFPFIILHFPETTENTMSSSQYIRTPE